MRQKYSIYVLLTKHSQYVRLVSAPGNSSATSLQLELKSILSVVLALSTQVGRGVVVAAAQYCGGEEAGLVFHHLISGGWSEITQGSPTDEINNLNELSALSRVMSCQPNTGRARLPVHWKLFVKRRREIVR